MTDPAIIALIAAGSAVVGGFLTAVIGPWIKHWLEQRAATLARRREQIERWRAMVLDINQRCLNENEVGQLLQLHKDYLSLEPHLSEKTRLSIFGDNRTVVVGQS